MNKIDPKVKDVLKIVGAGALITANLLIPGSTRLAAPILNNLKNKEHDDWKKYNKWRLKQVLRRLHKQKMVEVKEEKGEQIVILTDKGRRKLLKYELNKMELQKPKWDGYWRIIIYDIFTNKKSERYLFHKMLKKLEFLQIQRSVYLTPYPCRDEIEYLRQICRVGTEVYILQVSGIENESVYREYFGLT